MKSKLRRCVDYASLTYIRSLKGKIFLYFLLIVDLCELFLGIIFTVSYDICYFFCHFQASRSGIFRWVVYYFFTCKTGFSQIFH